MRTSVAVGIDNNSYLYRSRSYRYLSVLDICFSSLVIAPLVIAFWCGTWISLNYLKVPYIPFIFGFSVNFIFTVAQKRIQVIFSEHVRNRFLYFFSSRLYTEIFGIASVSSWYGIWTTVDSFAGANVKTTTFIVLASYFGLVSFKTARNITSSPFIIVTDKKEGYFDYPTFFQWSRNWKKNKILYILDSIFSVFVVGTLVVLVWRGAWCLLDQAIFPGESTYELSGWISLGIGYIIVLITFAIQSVTKILVRQCYGWKRLTIIDAYIVLSFCGTINIWRGVWILLEIYGTLEISLRNCIILHCVSFLILVIFNSSNTLLVRGVYIDAEENGEDCIEFSCYYFRLKFQEKLEKKTTLELNHVSNGKMFVDDCVDKKNHNYASNIKNTILTEKNEVEAELEINQQDPLISPTSKYLLKNDSAMYSDTDDKENV